MASCAAPVCFAADDTAHPFHCGHPARVRVGEHVYTSAEQAFMHAKAVAFPGNAAVAAAVLATDDYATLKAHGRSVVNFDPAAWAVQAADVQARAQKSKFEDPVLRGRLLATGDAPLRQVHPTDAVWSYPGANKLGAILEDVRAAAWGELLV